MKNILFFVLLAVIASQAFATHMIGGEITYEHISGNTYKIKVTTYTNTDPATTQADRCTVVVYFGDGDSATAPRINGPAVVCGYGNDGEPIAQYLKKNIYEVNHVYSGNGEYVISTWDPNREAGICNMTNSVDEPFYIETILKISADVNSNNSLSFNSIPIYYAVVDSLFSHNLMASDSDGDSLTYEFVPCKISEADVVPGYTVPAGFSIESTTGQITWNVPTMICKYNFAVNVREWRNGAMIGIVRRDFQIITSTDVSAGTVDLKSNTSHLKLFPNPAVDKISVENLNFNAVNFLFIYDFTGKLIKETELINTHKDIDISAFPEGVYHVKVVSNGIISASGNFIKTN